MNLDITESFCYLLFHFKTRRRFNKFSIIVLKFKYKLSILKQYFIKKYIINNNNTCKKKYKFRYNKKLLLFIVSF
jgi:hypothetical protein